MRIRNTLLMIVLGVVAAPAFAQEVADPDIPDILSMRERASVRDAWLTERLDTVIPLIMRREGADMWVIIAREYNEDPVVTSMLPATWLRARRRTVLVFYDPGEGPVERLAVSRYPVGTAFPAAWAPEEQPDQWVRLAEIIVTGAKSQTHRRQCLRRSSASPMEPAISNTRNSPPPYRASIAGASTNPKTSPLAG